MVEITNSKQLEEWLRDKPAEVGIAIAARAALRTVPFLTDLVQRDLEKYATDIMLPVFRAMAASWLAGTWPSQGAAFRSAGLSAALSADLAADSAALSADSAGLSADFAAAFWSSISPDVTAINNQSPVRQMMGSPLWVASTPEWVSDKWPVLRKQLVSLDSNWRVWTDWYDDRLRGAEDPRSRPLVEELELARVLIPDEDWRKGPAHVNALIADMEAHYRAATPAQRPAIIEVAYGEDGRLHRVPSAPPGARDDAQADRQRAAWQAHSEQLAELEEMNPGGNEPRFGSALKAYRAALGLTFDEMNVIALGVHGSRIDAYAARADDTFLEDIASEVVALSAAHGLFIRQFPEWLNYVADASGEPTGDAVNAAIAVAKATINAPEIIGEDVAEAATSLAADANPDDQPPQAVKSELLRSVGNVLSGMFEPLVAFARDAKFEARRGSLDGIKEFSKKATLAVAFGGASYVLALAAGMPAEFGWIIPVLTLLKSKLKG